MQTNPVIDLTELIDRRGLSAFHYRLFALTILIVFADGYDVVSIAYVAPMLRAAWTFNPAMLKWLFAAGFAGGLLGPAIFGYLADRYGRKYTTIIGTLFFGLFTLLQVWATDIDRMILLRFIAGIGISGIIPTIVALNAEYAPRRLQTTIAIVSFIGIAFGGLLAGLVAVNMAETYGWPIVFWVGGIVPIAAAVIGFFVFPESAKFLSLRPKRRRELFETLRQLIPSFAVPADADFVIGGEINRNFRFRDLFDGWLRLGTPLLWIINVLTLMVFFFVNQWIPTILTNAGMPVQQAQWGTLILQIGNIAGAFSLMRPLAKWGYWPVALGCGVTIPFLAVLGHPGLPFGLFLGAVFVSGIGIAWLQFGDIAAESQIYPTYTRSWGIGICFAFLRLGSLLGPFVGGVLIERISIEQLFLVVGAVQGLNFLATLAFAPVYRARMRELAEASPQTPPTITAH